MAGANVSDAEASEGMEEQIQLVAHEIGRDWKKLGRRLRTTEAVIEGIEDEFKQLEEKAYQILKKWSRANGKSGATREVLCKALKEIGRKSIAERICAHKHSNESPEKAKLPHQTTDSTDKAKLPSDLPSSNGFKLEKQLKEEAETMLKYCQESIPTCDPPELGHMLIFVEHIKALNEMLMKCREDSFEANDNDEPEIAEVKRKERVRYQQTEQTILMIEDRLLQVPEEKARTRTMSEILHRCTSIVIPPRRSDTDSSAVLGRRPASIARSSHLLPTDEEFCKKIAKSKQVKETQSSRCCHHCVNHFERLTCVSEKEEKSKPDAMLHYKEDQPGNGNGS